MPPSPAMRCSPGREPRADNHKRGRSLESGIPAKQRDDDLALFNEVQSRERDNFLLQADDDDFEHIFPNKLRYFSDYKLGINIPARGESSDLLHAEEEKNDYEWLLTPPDTPLFASLDDEAPQVNLAQRGRAQTQPISISRSSTMEKSHRSSRGSASPNRVSLSPRSHNSPFEGRGQASSAPTASPPTSFRPTTASLRSSPPSRKSVPRASTSAPRRLSTGSNGTMNARGISPVKTNRGNSASPKIRAWQSNIPGFSTEVPPNLRTSLADRPASYVRGSSPASRHSRQSMSPTASRSISSSHSHERDRFSSHSKGSVASSAEDDMESLSSILVVSAQRSNSRRVGGFQNNNKASLSKKPSRVVSSSSAPKRSFDLALRQMDQKKGPQNMFRPLLSSVPSSTFHAGIASSGHHTAISRNSSVTTSSNASSGLGISGLHDPEASQDDATSGCVNVQVCDVDDDVFVIEKDDGAGNESHGETRSNQLALLDDSRNIGDRDPATSVALDDISDINSQKDMLICSGCGSGYSPMGPVEKNANLCADCIESYTPLTVIDPVPSIVVSGSETEVTTIVEPQMAVVKARSGQHDELVKDGQQSTYGEPIWNFLSESSLSRSRSEECESKVDFLNPKIGSSEGAGISILLKRSSSIKGAVVRNTNFSASSISYDDLSYVRDSTNSMRSVSASSSVDFGLVRQVDTRFQRQLSSTKSETENYKFDVIGKHQRSGSSLSGASSHAFHPPSLGTSTLDPFGRDVQENTVENGTCFENDNGNNSNTAPNQTRVDSGESLLTNSQKVEDLGPDDATALQTGTSENGTARDPCVDSMDVEEVPLDAISEEEFDKTCRSSPASKCDVSISSMSSIEELQEDVAVPSEDYDTSNLANDIIEESMVLVGHEGGLKGRSLTLEEATDTILFCSSIVHNLAHNAAAIAIEKENPSDDNGSWPLVPATRKADLDKTDRNATKRSSKSHRSRHKKEVETDTVEVPNTTTETEGKTDQPKTRIVGVRDSNNGESKKPPMLESKCNCTIM
ncbi:hypothetical protein L6452_21307 [Arctium lappa]|uniref:Uncharacterized protein n=1 Tax=Arctium lappa TaxID=4217 RepID=A0ACB9BF22_ARCLA|nr:hypothetical protein L6452_21307 [Arctium lappa]